MNSDYFLVVADNEFWPHQQRFLRDLDLQIERLRHEVAEDEAECEGMLGRQVRLRSAIAYAAYMRKSFREMVLKDFQIAFGRTIS